MQTIGVIGLGTMGLGIAELIAIKGHDVIVFDNLVTAREKAASTLRKNLERRRDKGKLGQSELEAIVDRVSVIESPSQLSACGLVIEAVIEELHVKQFIFKELEEAVSPETILATNTSSLSVTDISTACKNPDRVIGLHFFNPAQVMPLVEIVPTVKTSNQVVERVRSLSVGWGKTVVIAKDSPGFIVNRVARPYYGESLCILEEGIADAATIDWAMKSQGGFAMGPFELIDLIGNDINLSVSESVYQAFDCAPRFRTSALQRTMVESGRLGKKSGRGFYDYSSDATPPTPKQDLKLAHEIFLRVVSMLINEATDAFASGVASRDDIDTAMRKGVNYPKGPLAWGDELGLNTVLTTLNNLRELYKDPRYTPHPLLIEMVAANRVFYG